MIIIKRYWPIILICLCLAALFFLQLSIDKQPEKEEIVHQASFTTLPSAEYLGAYLGSIILGGAKPIIVDALWMRMDKLKQHRQYEEISSLANLIAELQPKFVDVWWFNSGVLAYDISLGQDTLEKRWDYVNAGIDYLKKGLEWNPDDPVLLEQIALIYYHRFPQEEALMDRLEKATGKDCYTWAMEWYEQVILALKKKNTNLYRIEMKGENMKEAAQFKRVFELVKKGRFAEANAQADTGVDYCNQMGMIYKLNADTWGKRGQAYRALKSVIPLEEVLSAYSPLTQPDEFFAHLSPVITRYREMLETEFIENELLIGRMGTFFQQCLLVIYQDIDRREVEAVRAHWSQLQKVTALTQISDPKRKSASLFPYLQERFNHLLPILQSEEAFLQTLSSNPAFSSLLAKLIESYEDYITNYNSDLFSCNVEQERLKKWQKAQSR